MMIHLYLDVCGATSQPHKYFKSSSLVSCMTTPLPRYMELPTLPCDLLISLNVLKCWTCCVDPQTDRRALWRGGGQQLLDLLHVETHNRLSDQRLRMLMETWSNSTSLKGKTNTAHTIILKFHLQGKCDKTFHSTFSYTHRAINLLLQSSSKPNTRTYRSNPAGVCNWITFPWVVGF